MTFNILVTRDGGPSGYGETLLKNGGKVMEFNTREAAEKRAAEYRERMNHQFSIAHFTATVVEAQ